MPLLKDLKPLFLSPVVKSFIVELVAPMNMCRSGDIWQVRGGLIEGKR